MKTAFRGSEMPSLETPIPCFYTATNATDLLQVVSFTGFLQLVNKLQQTCQFHQVVKIRLVATC